jgi:hypothetical protein
MSRGGTAWSSGLVVTLALTYATVAAYFFAAGYVIGRLLV